MKQYLLIITSLLLGVGIFNQIFDIAEFDSKTSTLKYAQAQKQDLNAVVLSRNGVNQRAWVLGRFKTKNDCPDVLVMGSSTVSQVSKEMFSADKLLNFYLWLPSIEDYEGIFQISHEAGCVPKKVVMGLDHWLFNQNLDKTRWIGYTSSVLKYDPSLHNIWNAVSYNLAWFRLVLEDRLSYGAFRESFRSLLRMGKLSREYPKLLSLKPEEFCSKMTREIMYRTSYGTDYYCPSLGHSEEEVTKIATTYYVNNSHGIQDWKEVQPRDLLRLKTLSQKWTSKGAQVTWVAPPFHPVTYKRLLEQQEVAQLFNHLDRELESLSRELKIPFINTRNPSEIGCTNDDFMDSHHSKPNCIAKVIAQF